VARGLFGKLFGSEARIPPQLAQAFSELAKLTQARPALEGAVPVWRSILGALFSVPVTEKPPSLAAATQAKLAQGVPLLRGETLHFDRDALQERWCGVCNALAGTDSGSTAQAVREAFTNFDPVALVHEVLEGRSEAVLARAEALQLDPAMTATVLRLSFFPVLAEMATALAPLRAESPWALGSCWACGSWPALAELRGLEQTRVLRCACCASGWVYPRLRCPFCNCSDHRQLGFFHAEGEEARYRAATCESCHAYLKTVSTLDAMSPTEILVTDFATLHLDLAAADRGYWV
jgi:FdhE protein